MYVVTKIRFADEHTCARLVRAAEPAAAQPVRSGNTNPIENDRQCTQVDKYFNRFHADNRSCANHSGKRSCYGGDDAGTVAGVGGVPEVDARGVAGILVGGVSDIDVRGIVDLSERVDLCTYGMYPNPSKEGANESAGVLLDDLSSAS